VCAFRAHNPRCHSVRFQLLEIGAPAATNRLRIQAQLRGNPFLRHLLTPEPKDVPEFDHRDLKINPRLLPSLEPRQQTSTARSDGGKGFEKPHSGGGKVRKSPQEGVASFRKPTPGRAESKEQEESLFTIDPLDRAKKNGSILPCGSGVYCFQPFALNRVVGRQFKVNTGLTV